MSATIDNLLPKQAERYGTQRPVSEAEWAWEREKCANRQDADDIGEICAEAALSILDAVRTGDADLIGRTVLAACGANLDRRADRVCCIDPDKRKPPRPTPEVAARCVLLGASIGRVS